MRLDDILAVLRDEFAQTAADIDAALASWFGAEPTEVAAHGEAVSGLFDKLAEVSRMVGLVGHAAVIEQLRDATAMFAFSDMETMGQGLGWLAMWREPLAATFDQPGDPQAADGVLAYLSMGPVPPSDESQAILREMLCRPAALPIDEAEQANAFAPPTEAEVSIEVPEDVDADLLETFLAEAPDQLVGLGDTVRALTRGPVDPAQLVEAQRCAHTFKGSGNIIGIRGVGRMAHAIEDILEFALAQGGHLPTVIARDVERASSALDQMIYALRGEEEPPSDTLALLGTLVDWARAIDDGSWEELAQELGAQRAVPVSRAAPVPSFEPTFEPPTDHHFEQQAVDRLGDQRFDPPSDQAGDQPSSQQVDQPSDRQVDLSTHHAYRAAAQPVAPLVDRPTHRPVAATADASTDAAAQIRVSAARVDQLVRQAGQNLVRQARLTERLRSMDARLVAMKASHGALAARLRDLQIQIDRQGVSLQEKSGQEGASFDPLEMDRYNELHALTRFVAEMAADGEDLSRQMQDEVRAATLDVTDHGRSLKAQHDELLRARMAPFRNIAARLRRNVSQTASVTGKQVQLVIDGDGTQLDGDILERLTEPLLHLLRNAVDHGIESPEDREYLGKPVEGTVHLAVTRDGQTIRLVCRDDGRGLDIPAIHAKALSLGLVDANTDMDSQAISRLILLPGFSTRELVSEVSGRGVGMDVVAERLKAMKGHIDIASEAFEGSTFILRVPATTGAAHVLVVEVGGQAFALPTDAIVIGLSADQIQTDGDGRVVVVGERSWPVASLAERLGLPESEGLAASRPAIVLRIGREEQALWIDRVVEAREMILQDVGRLLQRVRGVSSAAFRPDGRVLLVLDPEALGARDYTISSGAAQALRQRLGAQRKRALVVDDSLSVRKSLEQLVGDAGYDVLGARDGFDALEMLVKEQVDIVITDLEMPNLNGLDLTRRIREEAAWAQMPVIMLTSRSNDKHRQRAAEVGVSAYMTKPYTDDDLLSRVRELLGE